MADVNVMCPTNESMRLEPSDRAPKGLCCGLQRLDFTRKKTTDNYLLRFAVGVNNGAGTELQSNTAHCVGCTRDLPNHIHRVDLVEGDFRESIVRIFNFGQVEACEVVEGLNKVPRNLQPSCDRVDGDLNERTYSPNSVFALKICLKKQQRCARKNGSDRADRLYPRSRCIRIDRRVKPPQCRRPTDDTPQRKQAASNEVFHA